MWFVRLGVATVCAMCGLGAIAGLLATLTQTPSGEAGPLMEAIKPWAAAVWIMVGLQGGLGFILVAMGDDIAYLAQREHEKAKK